MEKEVFNQLNPAIQKAVYKLGWRSLRPIQVQAMEYLLRPDAVSKDLVLVAPTASGKTEAVFLPLISNIIPSATSGIKILYISPLKALINDQFSRIQNLCSELDFPITPWHGDANYTQKKNILNQPEGIMLITPESIESIFQNHSNEIERLWNKLDYIIIDEIHTFIERSRGVHLRSLIYRICRECSVSPSIIGLSATVANPEVVAKWIRPNNLEQIKIIQDTNDDKAVHGIIASFDNKQGIIDLGLLYSYTKKKKCLVYANRKSHLESACVLAHEYFAKQNLIDNIGIHHGSLSKEIRQETEFKLKNDDCNITFCSPTLELGIDIGGMDRIIFLSPPSKVSSFIQWLGRSGRESDKAREFAFLLPSLKTNNRSRLNEKINADLVQSIAITELFFEGWQEPLSLIEKDYSTFAHQLLSYLGQRRYTNLKTLYNLICKGAFNNAFSLEELIELLRSMKEKNLIHQPYDNSIQLTQHGEHLVERFDFYSVFNKDVEWTVIGNGKEIGSLYLGNNKLKKGDVFILAGLKWEVVEVIPSSLTVIAQKCSAKRVTLWHGGHAQVHKIVHQKMLELYSNKKYPPYLSDSAKRDLQNAYKEFDLLFIQKNKYIPVFSGSKVMNTLHLILWSNCDVVFPVDFIIENNDSLETVRSTFRAYIDGKLLIESCIIDYPREFKESKKYDYLLTDNQLNDSFINSQLDIEGAKEFCKRYLETLKRH